MSHGSPQSPVLRLANRSVGGAFPTYLIAEIGCNHDGKLDRAVEAVCAVAEAGADAVKFQSFHADRLTRASEPAHPLLMKLGVPKTWYGPLCSEARRLGIHFLSTPFDEQSADELASFDLPAYKIASGDLTHHSLLRHVARLGRPVLLSTGLAHLQEVADALQVLRDAGCQEVALLHCVAAYPPGFDEINLRAVATLAEGFETVVGLSDHSPGHVAVLGAVALGASVIEKHVTFDRSLPGPDHAYALTFAEFAEMARDVRILETCLGDGCKQPAPSEEAGRLAGRRSIHAAVELREGVHLERSMLKVVRPADGIAASEVDALLGRRICRGVEQDAPICWQDLS